MTSDPSNEHENSEEQEKRRDMTVPGGEAQQHQKERSVHHPVCAHRAMTEVMSTALFDLRGEQSVGEDSKGKRDGERRQELHNYRSAMALDA